MHQEMGEAIKSGCHWQKICHDFNFDSIQFDFLLPKKINSFNLQVNRENPPHWLPVGAAESIILAAAKKVSVSDERTVAAKGCPS